MQNYNVFSYRDKPLTVVRTVLGTVVTLVSLGASVTFADAGYFASSSSSRLSGVSSGPAMRPPVVAPQVNNRPATSTAGRINGIGNSGFGSGGAKPGNLGGVGVPGAVTTGSIISSGTTKDVGTGMPSTATDRVGAKVGSLKDSQGQAQGRQQNSAASERQIDAMQNNVAKLKTSQGQTQGRDQTPVASTKQAATIQKGLDQLSKSRGQEVGSEKKDDSGVKLSNKQIQEIKQTTVNPKINRDVASNSDEKGGKGGKSGTGKTEREKDLELAKHAFDFAKGGVKPIVFPTDKIVVPRPNPPKLDRTLEASR